MVLCAVATCNNRSGRNKNVAFFCFPKNSKLRRAWIYKCWRKKYRPSQHAKVCEHHFIDSDFILSRSFAASLGYNEKFRLQLKPDAIPSIFGESRLTSTTSRKKKKSPRKSNAMIKRRKLEVRKPYQNREIPLTYNKTNLRFIDNASFSFRSYRIYFR